MTDDRPGEQPRGWPEPAPDQVRVLLLGTFHMANPGRDEVNVEADDVLAPGRQAELAALADRLEGWHPERIAVEWPHDRQAELDERYREYRAGDLEDRNEVFQVGCRLADRLDHGRVHAVDYRLTLENDALEELQEGDFDPERKTPHTLPDVGAVERERERRLAESTVPEYLAWINEERQLQFNHEVLFTRGLRWGAGDNFGGPRSLARWYERNLYVVHNLWRAVEPGDERALVVVVSGHVRVMRHLLDEAPMFCPVSPLPYLP